MESSNKSAIDGITVKNTANGFIIELNGPLYKTIGDNINKGKITKSFYHELKQFVQSIENLG